MTFVLTVESDDVLIVRDANGQTVNLTPAPASSGGITQLTGDVTAGPGSGSVAATVVALQGQPVAATVPSEGNVLTFQAGDWVPAVPGGAVVILHGANDVVPHGGSFTTPDIAALPTAANLVYELVVHCLDLGAGEQEGNNDAATIGWQLQENFGQLVGHVINQAGSDRHINWLVLLYTV